MNASTPLFLEEVINIHISKMPGATTLRQMRLHSLWKFMGLANHFKLKNRSYHKQSSLIPHQLCHWPRSSLFAHSNSTSCCLLPQRCFQMTRCVRKPACLHSASWYSPSSLRLRSGHSRLHQTRRAGWQVHRWRCSRVPQSQRLACCLG